MGSLGFHCCDCICLEICNPGHVTFLRVVLEALGKCFLLFPGLAVMGMLAFLVIAHSEGWTSPCWSLGSLAIV